MRVHRDRQLPTRRRNRIRALSNLELTRRGLLADGHLAISRHDDAVAGNRIGIGRHTEPDRAVPLPA